MLLALVLGVVSCQNEPEGFDVVVGGEQEVMLNVSLPEATRGTSAQGFDFTNFAANENYDLRFILEIRYQNGDETKVVREVKPSETTSATFPVRLAPNRVYTFTVWADLVKEDSNADLFYDTTNLSNITLKTDVDEAIRDIVELRDAYTHTDTFNFTEDRERLNMTLVRPFAKVRVVATDLDKVTKFGIIPDNAAVEYTSDVHNSFNAVTGNVNDGKGNPSFTYNISANDYGEVSDENEVNDRLTVFADYIFVPNNGGTISFNLNINQGTDLIKANPFSTQIPVEKNKVTSIVGDVLTEGGNVSITINGTLEEKETIKYVDTAESLQKTINNIAEGESGNIKLGGDIDLNDLLGAGILSTRAAEPTYGLLIPAGKRVVLDLQGYTISQVKECKASYSMIQNNGNLTIIDSSEAKSGKISFKDTSAGDPSFGWGSYTISNYGGTLVVENGTIEHLGEQNAHMICAIWQYNGSTTINGGVISTPNYRSARLWSGDMTINGGVFEGQLWLQASDNNAALTITGGTFAPRGGDSSSVYVTNSGKRVQFAVTGGDFKTKIGMSEPFGCITGGTFTTTAKEGTAAALINDDYQFVNGEEDNTWVVTKKPTIAKIGDDEYTSLAKAVAEIQDGETITLVANEVFTENNYYDNGGWKDGLGYSGDKSFTIDLNGYTISQNGALNDYLIWIKNDGSKANTITLKNGTLDAGTTAYCAFATASSNKQKITINLEDINLVGNNSGGAVAKIRGGVELNVKSGTVITGKNNYVGIEAVGNNTVVNIYDNVNIYQNGTSSYVGGIVGASYNATMNIYGGYGKSAKCGIIVMSTGATINVSGGEWIANNDGTVATDNNAVLVSQNNRYETGWACKSILNVTGGTFKGGYNCYGMGPGVEPDDAQINIKGGNFNSNPANYVVAGYETKEENGVYTVGKPQALADFEAAIAQGDNVTLTEDITLLEPVVIKDGKEVVLDLNGKTVNAPLFSAFEVKNGAELTIKNGKVVAYESTVRAIGGKATIESGEYTSTGTALDSPATYRYSLDCRENGELVVNGGTFKSNNGMINVSSTVTINGGKFENVVEKSMTRHFAYVSAPLTINDGEFYGKANSSGGGCFFCGAGAGGDIQINGGKFTSLWTSGSVNRIFEVYFGGTINVTGGMFNTNGGIATFVTENTDEATKAAYPYVAK